MKRRTFESNLTGAECSVANRGIHQIYLRWIWATWRKWGTIKYQSGFSCELGVLKTECEVSIRKHTLRKLEPNHHIVSSRCVVQTSVTKSIILCQIQTAYVFQIPTYCSIYLLDKTHVKIRTSNPLKFFNITLLHVSILPDHHQGVNIPIYEVIEYFYICWCYWYGGGLHVVV